MKEARDIIRKPILTEKSMGMAAENKYTFEVDDCSNKIEIRQAIEKIFKVKVLSVRTATVRGKKRRTGGVSRKSRGKMFTGFTSEWKKAIVTLKQGDKIELGGVNLFEA